MLIQVERSVLLIVDLQERLLPAMLDPEDCARRCDILAKAALRLGVPRVVSQQYPKGLGPTVATVAESLNGATVLDKLHFSCAADPAIAGHVRSLGRDQLVVAGIEAHVCVLQSALGFVAGGMQVFVAADAASSRRAESRDLAFDRMRSAGIEIVDTEMVLFEWLGRAATPAFRELSALIR